MHSRFASKRANRSNNGMSDNVLLKSLWAWSTSNSLAVPARKRAEARVSDVFWKSATERDKSACRWKKRIST